jgi:localization factor PodJL
MNRVSWSIEEIEPSVRERAEAAAKRAGLSLTDWINGQLGEAPQPPADSARMSRAAMPERSASEVAEIHQRLDAIARQIDHISRTPARNEPPVARQLNDAISRLDARLARITEPKPAARPAEAAAVPPQTATERVERAAAEVYATSPTLDPNALDKVIAEIAARQSELDAGANRMPRQPASFAPPIVPAMAPPSPPAGPDFSSLEQQLHKITGQIDALQRSDKVEQSIAAFRADLAEIRQTITEALPRKAIESLEGEVRSLAQRLDESRANGSDGEVVAGIERALGDIHAALRSLTPAEQLAGFDEAIRNLGGKIDMIVRNADDPGTVQQLENAIGALRGIVSNVASNEALAQLGDNVQALAEKIEQLAQADSHGISFAALEQRISALTAALESRERPAPSESTEQLESAVRALSERIDHLPIGNDDRSAFAHLEQRVSHLLERMEAATEQRGGSANLGRVEEGLQDILRMLERQQSQFSRLTEVERSPAPVFDPSFVDTIKRELSDMRFSQSETDRHTQDSLEAVHNTLGHVVDRLAMIEGDLRAARATPPLAPPPATESAKPAFLAAAPIAPASAAPVVPAPPPPQPEMPNPAAEPFAAAPRDFAAGRPAAEPATAAASPRAPKAIHDILDPAAADRNAPKNEPASAAAAPQRREGVLPPDHPLEPGTKPPGRIASPSERIAASESALGDIAPASPEPANATSFIAAARRAAQAAASASGAAKAKPGKPKTDGDKPDPDGTTPGSTLGSKIKSLLVGASVVVIVLSSFQMAMKLFDNGEAPPVASVDQSRPAPAPDPQNAPTDEPNADPTEPAAPPAIAPIAPPPSMISPTPVERQSLYTPQAAPAATAAASDVTGTIPSPSPSAPAEKFGTIAIPSSERLPEAIGGAKLRSAALKGDAAAAYEVASRYAEGKGVPVNYDEAAKWYQRAADAGVTPAIFRIGTLYEKGLGVKKDHDAARKLYSTAADRGNAKAMHNLAVLYADGGSKGANYKTAAAWFRKAAERGVADSQFNLGILYARGIGVDQNLAESYKWFSLAAAQGDEDAGRKRDDVAKRLDPQSLAAAKLATQTFTAEPQPDAAVKVAAPAGGWDEQVGAATKRGSAQRAAR